MELFLYLIIIVAAYILFARISYMIWELLFDTISEKLNKRMKISSKILGILWPITSPILSIATFIILFNKVTK